LAAPAEFMAQNFMGPSVLREGYGAKCESESPKDKFLQKKTLQTLKIFRVWHLAVPAQRKAMQVATTNVNYKTSLLH